MGPKIKGLASAWMDIKLYKGLLVNRHIKIVNCSDEAHSDINAKEIFVQEGNSNIYV
jgi:hypothetical protein